MSNYNLDSDNPLWVKGWGVFRNEPWHFDSLFPTEGEAQNRCAQLDSGYEVKFGARRLASDDFIY